MLFVSNLCKTFRDGQVHALRDVSFSIQHGEFVAITGKSGCGKTTLLQLIGGLDRPTSGDISVDNVSLEQWNLNRYRSQYLAFVFQSFYLLPNLTAAENVQLPMFEAKVSRGERQLRSHTLLESVGLGERLHHLPSQLSNGQRQRVAIARALANNPKVVLADEPTGSLDSQSGEEVMNLLIDRHLQMGVTLIVVTHDSGIASRAPRQIHMADGQIVEDRISRST